MMGVAVIVTAALWQLATGNQSRDDIYGIVLERLDKQNSIYYELSNMVGQLAYNPSDVDLLCRLEGFCEGTKIFSQNDIANIAIEMSLGNNQTLKSALRDLLSGGQIDTGFIQGLSSVRLQKMESLFRALGDCCDRGLKGQSIAYFIHVGEFDSEAYEKAYKETDEILICLSEFTA